MRISSWDDSVVWSWDQALHHQFLSSFFLSWPPSSQHFICLFFFSLLFASFGFLSAGLSLPSISCFSFTYFAAFHVSFSIGCLSLASVSEIFSCMHNIRAARQLSPRLPTLTPALLRIPNSYPVKYQFAVFSVGQAS